MTQRINTIIVGVLFAVTALIAACGSGDSKPVVSNTNPAVTQPAGSAGATSNAPSSGSAAVSTAGGSPERVASKTSLTGAGATFPFPLYSKLFDEYGKSVDPSVQVNYQSIGSGGGIKQITDKTVDFGATDGFMSAEQLAAAPGLLHIPMTMGAVVPTYNLPGVNTDLKFTGDVLADIYLGKVKKWNDQRMKENNPGVNLPNADITVVYRSDGSGTTYTLTDYLSSVSADFKSKVGVATSVSFPVGIGGKGNEGVTGVVKQSPGSLGYVELVYAEQNKLRTGLIKNKAGEFVKGSIDGVSAAASAFTATAPDDLRFSIVNADGAKSYPIAGFSWLLVYREQSDANKAQALTGLMWWALHDQKALSIAKVLNYAPVPAEIVTKAETLIKSISVNGQPALRLK